MTDSEATDHDPGRGDFAVRVTSLTKVYPLYKSPRDRLREALHPRRRKFHHDFYALRDVNFEVRKGETLGIIGQNGSGKSTLLSVISGVLTPSAGTVDVAGKISSLLELGTGFNPELTGMENIYFNGAIQGYSKSEMDRKLHDIVDFADIGEFINQPVKIYSSGMQVRLAFAVAINVDPLVFIIDEALAVGDMQFQQKCFRKINDFRDKGKTIILCSHDMGAIQYFCTSCIWIHQGMIKRMGKPEDIVREYIAWANYNSIVSSGQAQHTNVQIAQQGSTVPVHLWRDMSGVSQFGDQKANILSVAFFDENNQGIDTLKGGEIVCLAVKVQFVNELSDLIIGFNVKNKFGSTVFATNNLVLDHPIAHVNAGTIKVFTFMFRIPNLGTMTYSFDVAVGSGSLSLHTQHCWKYDTVVFTACNPNLAATFGQIFLRPEEVMITQTD
jgi:ABC-type polysaccharide/polyol phosphate transport system ATPase subunit